LIDITNGKKRKKNVDDGNSGDDEEKIRYENVRPTSVTRLARIPRGRED